MSEFQPTEEQVTILDLFKSGQTVAVQAGAGSGKTSTAVLLAESCPNRTGVFTAFNKAIITDAAGRLPSNTAASTMHSLAFRSVGKQYGHRLRTAKRMKSMEIARLLRIDPITVSYGAQRKPMAAGYLAGLAMRAVNRFCQSGDLEPDEQHVPYVDGIDVPTTDGRRTYSNNNEVRKHIMAAVRKAWADLQRVDGQLPFNHGVYLKIFANNDPRILCDFLLIDECQDLNGVLLQIIDNQTDVQKVLVGDSAQQINCQPVGTMVEVPAMAPPVWPDKQCSYPGCQRRRDHKASGRCDLHERRRLAGAEMPLPHYVKGNPTLQVPIESLSVGDLVVTFDNVHLFKRGRPITAISRFPYSGRLIRIRTAEGHSSAYTPEHHCIVRFGDSLVGKHAVYLMRKGDQFRIGRTAMLVSSQSKMFGVGVRSKAEGADAAWVLSVHESANEAALAEALAQHQFNIPGVRFRSSTKHRDSLDVERFWIKHGSNVEAGVRCLEFFHRLLDAPLWTRDRLKAMGLRRPFVTAAANLLDGMRVLPLAQAKQFKGKRQWAAPRDCWLDISVTEEWYEGDIVSLEVADHHNYFGDSLLTHNSWMGSIDALKKVTVDSTAYLTNSFRFGPAVADVANGLLERLDSPLRLTGAAPWLSIVGPVADPDCILTRTNATAVRQVLEAQEQGRKPYLMGGGQDLVAFAKAAQDLMDGRWVSHPELACFSDWTEVVDYADHDAQGDELRLMVKLITEYGTATIIRALSGLGNQADADLVVSTAHKSKGLQFDSVQLAGDFQAPKDGAADSNADELMLLYVACTRAKRELDVTAVPHALAAPEGHEEALVLPAWLQTDDTPVSVPAAPQEPTATHTACPSCGRTDVVRGGLVGAHRCVGATA